MRRFSWPVQPMTGGLQTRHAPARQRTARFRPQLNMLERRELLSFAAPVVYPMFGVARRKPLRRKPRFFD